MNNKLLNQLLSEWSFRSPDGLATGHSTPENIGILHEILLDANFSKEEINEVISNILSVDPICLTEDSINEEPASTNKLSPEPEYTGLPTEKTLESVAIKMLVKKQIKSDGYPEKILEILRKSNADVAKKFDTMTVSEAVTYLNTNPDGRKFSDELNTFVSKKGLGRGEYALLFLIKNAISGGIESGDLIVNDSVIDVKEFSAGAIRIPAPSLRLKFTSFYKDFFGLVNFLINQPSAVAYLNSLIETNLVKLAEVQKKAVIGWINNPDVLTLPGSVIHGLYQIGKFLKNNKEEDVEIVDLKFKGEQPQPMVMINPDDVKKKIYPSFTPVQNSEPTSVDITVQPLVDKVTQVTIPEIKNLQFFVKNRTREEITAELLKNTYNGGMIVIDEKTRNYIWLKHNELSSKLLYSRMSQGSSYFVLKS